MIFSEHDGMIRILRSASSPMYDGMIRKLKRKMVDGMVRILRSASSPTYDGMIRILKRNNEKLTIQHTNPDKRAKFQEEFYKYLYEHLSLDTEKITDGLHLDVKPSPCYGKFSSSLQ